MSSRPNPSDYWLHLLFLLMSVVIMLVSVVLRADDQRGVLLPGSTRSLPPLCTSRIVFGLDCPGCGLTRAFIAISHGRLERAWELNRASFAVYLFVAAQIPWQTIQAWRTRRGHAPLEWPGVYLIPIGLAILLVINWMLKVIGW